jgi:hypothetical protein
MLDATQFDSDLTQRFLFEEQLKCRAYHVGLGSLELEPLPKSANEAPRMRGRGIAFNCTALALHKPLGGKVVG